MQTDFLGGFHSHFFFFFIGLSCRASCHSSVNFKLVHALRNSTNLERDVLSKHTEVQMTCSTGLKGLKRKTLKHSSLHLHCIHLQQLHTYISKEECVIWTCHKLPKLCGHRLFLYVLYLLNVKSLSPAPFVDYLAPHMYICGENSFVLFPFLHSLCLNLEIEIVQHGLLSLLKWSYC